MDNNEHYDIGIVGWWFASNYGSALTYYSLGKIFEDLGYSSVMLQLSKLNRTPWDAPTRNSINFMKKYFPISKQYEIEEQTAFNDLCDTFVLGSDQLWTKHSIDILGYTFFLDFVESSKKKLAYATSFGNSEFTGTQEQKDYIHYLLGELDYISVREESGIAACKNAFRVKATRDLDPVFVCDKKHFDTLADACPDTESHSEYLFTYILDVNEEKQQAIDYIAKKFNLRVVSVLDMRVPDYQKRAWHTGELKDNITVEQFIYYIKNCKYMVTDSHHGACFAMIYNKNYTTFANGSRGMTRFSHLFNLFQMQDHLLYNVNDVYSNEACLAPIDYSNFNRILATEKENSVQRLLNALQKPKIKRAFSLLHRPPAPKPPLTEAEKLYNNPDFIKIRLLATLLRDYGVKHVVLSPGGRDVPLVRMFEYNSGTFTVHSVTDERSAAYYGLGIAAQLQQPVACVCTSGTAASNYLPAVTEAYYTGVPLIMITADRREIYLNHGEDQTIPQKHIFSDVVKKEITLPEGSGYQAEYQTRRDISECILETTHNGFGPVHINISIDNITMGAKAPVEAWRLMPKINPHILRVAPSDGRDEMMKWVHALRNSKRVLIVYGQNAQPTEKQRQNIERFASKYNCVIVTDFISNLDGSYNLKPYNMLQSISQAQFDEQLSPDILITVGGKRLMNDPLTYKVRGGRKDIRHWSVVPDGRIRDFYFRLSSVIECSQDYFFEFFANNAGDCVNNGEYYSKWKQMVDHTGAPAISQFNALHVQSKFLPAIPANSMLHLGVGQSFIECRRFTMDPSVQVFCNMGTNGIDGCTSTFMGQCAVAGDKLCFLLVGDLSFFYDMNSIWNKPLKKNMRILLVNNNGTGLLRGHNLKAISSVHNTQAKNWVESTGFAYMSASTPEEYEDKLRYFLSEESDRALFFEVFCN